ncbi:MAG: cupin domain-containing protein [Solirubrobacteraceae bacterium]|nr:cupin domain-containing protein [Patulibacter sp.]
MSTRRVVTGHNEAGKSVIASDEAVEPLVSTAMPGVEMFYLWGYDAPQVYPDAGEQPEWTTHFPPKGGGRFVIFSLPPAGTPVPEEAGTPEARADADATFPGLLDVYEADDPGMHTSETTDFAVVLSGQVVLELDDGEKRTLGPGDVVVQNGTRHRWINAFDERVTIGFVLLGAERQG